ncbi:MAG: glycosyltransferase [Bacilli bacterium]|nr:glycosyltransferase [Bacilli bacterium]
MKLSVLLPVKNQTNKLLYNLKEAILPYFDAQDITYDVWICYDGSTGEDKAQMEKESKSFPPHVHLVPYENRVGKGNNVKRAMLHSQSDYVLFMDADLATGLDTFEKMLPLLGKADCLIASRDIEGASYAQKQPFMRRLTHWGCRMVVAMMFHMKGIKDSQCGYKCIRTSLAKQFARFSIIDGYAFDVELLYSLYRNGFSIQEVPCVWSDDPDSSVSGLGGTVRRFISDLNKIKRNRDNYLYAKEDEDAH